MEISVEKLSFQVRYNYDENIVHTGNFAILMVKHCIIQLLYSLNILSFEDENSPNTLSGLCNGEVITEILS